TMIWVTAAALFACSKPKEQPRPERDYRPVLENAARIVVQTYKDLDSTVANLHEACKALETEPSQSRLDAARQAWRDARVFWEQSEGFLFGPVDTRGLDPAIDSWPVNKIDLDNVLASPNALTAQYVDALEGTLKGFHTIEYLLFGQNSSKSPQEFTPRQFEYLSACSQSLRWASSALYQAWAPEHENYAGKLINAGSNNVYPSQKNALEELVNGLIIIADEVGNGKINDPFAQMDLTLEESQFSNNSKADFADNMRSMQNIYTGRYRWISGPSLSDLVRENNPALDDKVKAAIAQAIKAIEDIPGTFSDAIFNHRAEVAAAQQKVRDLLEICQAELLPYFRNLE
ncbi:MAG: imelysin family protein, partial [Bacteroidia bacterium]|nr:imelysin [Bacteroidia bacterium]MDW8335164.1 imelysin family protein [Bacteroidia bacterium]